MKQLWGFPCEIFMLVASDVERAYALERYAGGQSVADAAEAALKARLDDVRTAGRGLHARVRIESERLPDGV